MTFSTRMKAIRMLDYEKKILQRMKHSSNWCITEKPFTVFDLDFPTGGSK